MRSLTKNKILRLFFVSFLLMMILPMALSVYCYSRAEALIYDELRQKHLALLESASNTMDVRFQEIDNLLNALSLNREVSAMRQIRNPAQQKDAVYTIYKFGETLSNFHVQNRFVETFYLYFGGSDIVASPYDTYLDSSFFYERFFRVEGMDYEAFRALMSDAPNAKTFYPAAPVYISSNMESADASRFFCVRSLTPYGQGPSGVSILLVIQEAHVLEMLQPRWADGHSAVVDENGAVLVASDHTVDWGRIALAGGSTAEVDGQEAFVFSVRSAYNSWQYVSVIPQQQVIQRVLDIQRLFVVVFAVSLVLGILFSFLLAYSYSKPIAETASRLQGYFGGKPHEKMNLRDVKDRTLDLLSSQASLNSRIQKQMPMLKAAFVHSLLRGEAMAGDMREMCAQLDMDFPWNTFLVFSIHVEGVHPASAGPPGTGTKPPKLGALYSAGKSREIAKELILSCFSHAQLHEDGMNRLVLLLNVEHPGEAYLTQLNETIRYITATASERYGVDLLFAAGDFAQGLGGICHSFFQSREALEYKVLEPDRSFIRYGDLPSAGAGFYFPRDLENKLINLLHQGNSGEVSALIRDILDQNLTGRSLTPDMLLLFTQSLCACLVKAADAILTGTDDYGRVQGEILAVAALPTVKKQREELLRIAGELCAAVNAQKRSRNTGLVRDILSYIESNYQNPDMSLTFVAGQFSISEVYLSQFFKEQAGVNFSVHLENTRMEAAQRLLLQTDKTIEEISGLVGYSSAPVFRNAFKRRNGISPMQYRKSKA